MYPKFYRDIYITVHMFALHHIEGEFLYVLLQYMCSNCPALSHLAEQENICKHLYHITFVEFIATSPTY